MKDNLVNDTISRAAAIEAVSKVCFELRGVFGQCEDALKALPFAQSQQICEYWDSESKLCALCRPSAQPEQRWTPCSRELPKKDGNYLVTTHNGQIARYIFIGGFSDEYWRKCATAWMPLPEPYREKISNGPESTKD